MPVKALSDRERDIVTLAERVMGWKVLPDRSGSGVTMLQRPDACNIATWKDAPGGDGRSWNPLVSLVDAWMLVEKLTEGGKRAFNVKRYQIAEAGVSPVDDEFTWFAAFYDRSDTYNGHGATAPVAICGAALASLSEGKNA